VTAPGAGPGQDRSQDDGLFAAPWAARPRQEPATHEPATRTGTPAASSARGRALPIEDALRSPFAPPPADAPAPAAAPRGSFAPPATADASTAPPVHGAPPTTAPAPALTPADVLAVPVAQRAPASPLFASPTAPQAQPAPAPEHLVGTLDGLDLDLGADPADPAGTTDPADPWAPTDPAARRPRRRRRVPVALAATGLVLALVAGAVGGVLGERLLGDDRIADAGLPAAVGSGAGDRAPDSVAGIAAQVLPSVVSIEVTSAQGASTGSGVVLRQDGYILTNHHVVADAAGPGATVTALFADGSQEVATIVGSTADYDLAVIKVEVTGLTPLVLGDSDEVQVGDPVVAVGAPLGLAGTVTSGIVSALNRPVAAGEGTDTPAFIKAIQTDAAINPGNSGGPLVNAAGEVIGINSAIAQPPGVTSSAGGSIGLGFAIPSNQARRTAEQLIETGSATYPVIGVLLDSTYTGEGVQVLAAGQDGAVPVTPGGPADRAGIRAGDVILSIDGRPVTESDELVVAIRARTPGEAVLLRVRTDGVERDVRVVLEESGTG
jgi:putative serine protease PepD